VHGHVGTNDRVDGKGVSGREARRAELANEVIPNTGTVCECNLNGNEWISKNEVTLVKGEGMIYLDHPS
jgi:NAD(P)H-nitrite reductase large subunit